MPRRVTKNIMIRLINQLCKKFPNMDETHRIAMISFVDDHDDTLLSEKHCGVIWHRYSLLITVYNGFEKYKNLANQNRQQAEVNNERINQYRTDALDFVDLLELITTLDRQTATSISTHNLLYGYLTYKIKQVFNPGPLNQHDSQILRECEDEILVYVPHNYEYDAVPTVDGAVAIDSQTYVAPKFTLENSDPVYNTSSSSDDDDDELYTDQHQPWYLNC